MVQTDVLHLENLQHEATARGHAVILDEPREAGGDDRGMTPYEVLLAALGGCIAITVRLYAQRKGWPLEDVRVHLYHERVHAEDCRDCEHDEGRIDVIRKRVEFSGDLTSEQLQRLREIAGRCPVHRTLTGQLEILDAPLT